MRRMIWKFIATVLAFVTVSFVSYGLGVVCTKHDIEEILDHTVIDTNDSKRYDRRPWYK